MSSCWRMAPAVPQCPSSCVFPSPGKCEERTKEEWMALLEIASDGDWGGRGGGSLKEMQRALQS